MKMTFPASIVRPDCWATNMQAEVMKMAGPSPFIAAHTGTTKREAISLHPYLSSPAYISAIATALLWKENTVRLSHRGRLFISTTYGLVVAKEMRKGSREYLRSLRGFFQLARKRTSWIMKK